MLHVAKLLLAAVLFSELQAPALAQTATDLERSTENLAGIYTAIRNIALPPTSAEETGEEPVTQRLVLLLPGKVLNYYDYFPGDTYEAALENPDYDGQQVVIPPRVMENMFALTDIVSGPYPLRGQETGEHFSVIYENILNRLEVKGFTQKTQEEKQRYLLAIDYLAEEIPDPLDVEQNVTRFQLYRRSQDLYNQKRLEMEDTIAQKRRELPAIEYELWFQRNYPTLNSEVEGAYTEWLIFGEKEIVELYKAYLDVEAPGLDLEEARMILRAAGVTSLDRSKTIYPISFAPSNWYRYLVNATAVDLARRNKNDLNRDELQSSIGELVAKKRVLEALSITEPSSALVAKLNSLKEQLNDSNGALSSFSAETERLRQACLASRLATCGLPIDGTQEETVECRKYEEATFNSSTKILDNSELYLCVSDLDFQINNITATRQAIRTAIDNLEVEINLLRSKLSNAQIKFSYMAQHAADSQDQLDSQWLQFEYDASQSRSSSQSKSKHFSTAASFKASGLFWSAKASFSYSKSESSFRSAMSKSDLGVKGELLRVTVQRPWFRPSLFKSKHLLMRTTADDEITFVSPGPQRDETNFIKQITSNTNYLLPEYVTGLLLSRNVELTFRNVKASQAAHAVSVSHSSSLSGGWGPWRASFRYSYGRRERTFTAQASDNGLKITIPGAQVIGYYTQVVPKFP